MVDGRVTELLTTPHHTYSITLHLTNRRSFSTHPQSPPANRGDASAAPRPEVSR